MISMRNKWVVLFFMGMIAVTYFGTLLTTRTEIKVDDCHNISCQPNK